MENNYTIGYATFADSTFTGTTIFLGVNESDAISGASAFYGYSCNTSACVLPPTTVKGTLTANDVSIPGAPGRVWNLQLGAAFMRTAVHDRYRSTPLILSHRSSAGLADFPTLDGHRVRSPSPGSNALRWCVCALECPYSTAAQSPTGRCIRISLRRSRGTSSALKTALPSQPFLISSASTFTCSRL